MELVEWGGGKVYGTSRVLVGGGEGFGTSRVDMCPGWGNISDTSPSAEVFLHRIPIKIAYIYKLCERKQCSRYVKS